MAEVALNAKDTKPNKCNNQYFDDGSDLLTRDLRQNMVNNSSMLFVRLLVLEYIVYHEVRRATIAQHPIGLPCFFLA
jgi:hypothetical protein